MVFIQRTDCSYSRGKQDISSWGLNEDLSKEAPPRLGKFLTKRHFLPSALRAIKYDVMSRNVRFFLKSSG